MSLAMIKKNLRKENTRKNYNKVQALLLSIEHRDNNCSLCHLLYSVLFSDDIRKADKIITITLYLLIENSISDF